MIGAAAAAVGGGLLLRPRDSGAPHNEYFATLNAELKKNGPMRPCLVVDLDRLDHNIELVNKSMLAGNRLKHFRVVAKSVPSGEMIGYVMKQAGTNRLMAFHQPFLNQHAQQFPDADILLGKPMPQASARRFYDKHKGEFDPQRQLQWLIDTPRRAVEYLKIARDNNTQLGVNIELDVGLHRGGVVAGPNLAFMLGTIRENPKHLRFTGFMGYDPHVVKVPSVIASREKLLQKVMQAYEAAVNQLRRQFPELADPTTELTFNTAGSPTYRLHESEDLSNDIAVGSALVKPTDFDLDTLEDHLPAAFIATPVLKKQKGVQIPGLDGKSRILSWWDINQRQSYFLYGGYWKAQPESPNGLRLNGLYGRSTNQELLTGSPTTALSVDDQVVLRPTQSEFVFLQFGDLLAVRGGKIVDSWPVFDQNV
ncbi:MAG: DSD1 family PLP-dependent enzyme [Salinisphaeraceae bacterium]|nr:DSD1 family PLP-dependent enzyme [Salinisphaeraceae bacterium]